MSNLVVRSANTGEIATIVVLHERAFEGYFLTMMGPKFLALYYELVIESDDGVIIVGSHGGRIVGFVAGSVDPAGFYQRMSSNKLRFVMPLARALIRRPILLSRALFNVRKVRNAGRGDSMYGHDVAELTSIAVDPDQSGLGIGGVLVDAFLSHVRDLGMLGVSLTTDAINNESVNAFYTKKGFQLIETQNASGERPMNIYKVEL